MMCEDLMSANWKYHDMVGENLVYCNIDHPFPPGPHPELPGLAPPNPPLILPLNFLFIVESCAKHIKEIDINNSQRIFGIALV